MFDRFPAIRARLGSTLLLALAIGGAWFALETLVYRSGAYFHVTQPDSNTGAVVRALLVFDQQYRPGARNVLVFGDSRVAEGFSPAHAAGGDARFNFINLAVPGSTPRTWHYLLREIDRRDVAYDAVVVGTLYQSVHAAPLADWPLDVAHAARLVDVRDAWSFPATFESPELRDRARHATLFPALALRMDTQAMLLAPLVRANDIGHVRPAYLEAVRNYPGRDERMPEIRLGSDRQVADWGGATEAQRVEIEAAIRDSVSLPPALVAKNDAFLGRWLGSMTGLARKRGVPLIVYPLPRGPLPTMFADDPRLPPSLAKLGREPDVRVLPADLLADLESPEFFFDRLHPNRLGRERTGSVVGARVRAELAGAPRR